MVTINYLCDETFSNKSCVVLGKAPASGESPYPAQRRVRPERDSGREKCVSSRGSLTGLHHWPGNTEREGKTTGVKKRKETRACRAMRADHIMDVVRWRTLASVKKNRNASLLRLHWQCAPYALVTREKTQYGVRKLRLCTHRRLPPPVLTRDVLFKTLIRC